MATRSEHGFGLQERAAFTAARAARVVALCAPPGYRKLEFLKCYAGLVGAYVVCELKAGDAPDLAGAILDALVSGDRVRAARIAADRLTHRRDTAPGTSREALRREWGAPAPPGVFVLYDPTAQLATRAGADIFSELVGTAPNTRTIAVAMRAPLVPALRHAAEPDEIVSISAAELALTSEEFRRLAALADVDASHAKTMFGITRGWPLVTRLILGLCTRRRASAGVIAAASVVPFDSLLTFAVHRTMTTLETPVNEAVLVTALLGEATHRSLFRVLGDVCDDSVFERTAAVPFMVRQDGVIAVHGAVADILTTRFERRCATLQERILRAFTGEGDYAAAARVALAAGDPVRAAGIIDAAPPYTTAAVPLRDYERIIERLDRHVITQFPNVWIATIPYRSLSMDPTTYVREAETVYFCLPASTTPDQRAAAVMLLASAYVNVGRSAEADQLIAEALEGFASEPCTARASVLNFAASLRGIDGRFGAARALAREAAQISRDAFGESQTLHYIESHEAAYRGKQQRVVVVIDELLRRRRRDDLPLYLAYVAASGAMFSWANGDDAASERYLMQLEDAVTPGLEAGLSPILDAARGREARSDQDDAWPAIAAMSHLYRMGNAPTHAQALAAARAAATNADRRGDPYLQILAHTAVFVLDTTSREAEEAALAQIVAPVESPELHQAVKALITGSPSGMLEEFVRRRVLRGTETVPTADISIALLRGAVFRSGAEVHLTDKEFELLAILSSTHGPISRERIGEALWDHLDPGEWRNNLKVTVHRIRTKLDYHDAIALNGGRYRLAPVIDNDLPATEAFVRSLRPGDIGAAARDRCSEIVTAYRSGRARYDTFRWASALLARLEDVAMSAGLALALDARARGDLVKATDILEELRAIDPLDERTCELAITVHAAQGQFDSARREFQRYATALWNELGTKPSLHLTELVRSVHVNPPPQPPRQRA